MKEFVFTFGFEQPHENGYHVIKATHWGEARLKMCERFGTKWSMQYESREAAGVERFNLKEVK